MTYMHINSQGLSRNEQNQRPLLSDQIIVILIYLGLALITQSLVKTITIWPSAGVVMAAFLVFGWRIWPAIAIGTFLSMIAWFINAGQQPYSVGHILLNLVMIASNIIAAAIVLKMCGRVKNLATSFSQFKWVVNQWMVAVMVFGAVAVIPGLGAYWLLPRPEASYLFGVENWAISNMMGALVVAPFLMALWLEGVVLPSLRQLKPHILASLGLLILFMAMFGAQYSLFSTLVRQPSFLLLPLLFVALTCGQVFTFFFLAQTLCLLWMGTSAGYGPFVSSDGVISYAPLQAFIGFAATVVLIVQSLLSEMHSLREQWAEERRQINRQLEQKVAERTRALADVNCRLEALSITDALTGLSNRRHFDAVLAQEWTRATRLAQPLALGMIDIDRFKEYNDHYGHQAGDICLQGVARVLAEHIRRTGDLVARYGGEEFVFIAPATDGVSAAGMAKTVCDALYALQLPHKASALGCVTISIGVASMLPEDGEFASMLLARADKALYRAKDAGRNQVVLDQPG